MNNSPKAEVKVRFNNSVFLCKIENKYYNTEERDPYAISAIQAIVPNSQGGFNVQVESLILCAKCYTSGNYKEPSNIKLPTPQDINKILKK